MINFVITNTKKYRLKNNDILCEGKKCINVNKRLIKILESQTSSNNETLKIEILLNRIRKINRILEQCQHKDIIITKFVEKIWKKSDFFSNLGDYFLSYEELRQYLEYFYLQDQEIIANKKLEKDYKANPL